MKQLFKTPIALLAGAICVLLVTSCQKTAQNPSKTSSTSGIVTSAAFSSNQAIALSSSSGDTIYAVHICHPGSLADTVAASSLPDTVTNYLGANYSGYTFKVAFKIKDHSGTLEGYVVVIKYNSNPVALKFDANGIFVAVIEQQEGRDMHDGHGFHEGGCFGDRDGKHRDTISLSAMPSAVTAYFTTNYPNDTLKHAFVNRDTTYLVISKDTALYATTLKSNGTLIKRFKIYPHVISHTTLAESALPASISTYLTTTYPGYVFENAFEVLLNGTAKGYVVVIEENTTQYAVEFDASGNFTHAHTIR